MCIRDRGEDVIGILRFCVDGKDAFENVAEDGMYLTLVNRCEERRAVAVDLFAQEQLMDTKMQETFRELEFKTVSCLLDGEEYEIDEGMISLELAPRSMKILEINWI